MLRVKTLHKRVLSMVLTVLLTFMSIPIGVFALDAYSVSSELSSGYTLDYIDNSADSYKAAFIEQIDSKLIGIPDTDGYFIEYRNAVTTWQDNNAPVAGTSSSPAATSAILQLSRIELFDVLNQAIFTASVTITPPTAYTQALASNLSGLTVSEAALSSQDNDGILAYLQSIVNGIISTNSYPLTASVTAAYGSSYTSPSAGSDASYSYDVTVTMSGGNEVSGQTISGSIQITYAAPETVSVSGSVSAIPEVTLVFTNETDSSTIEATCNDYAYSVSLPYGDTYTISLKDQPLYYISAGNSITATTDVSGFLINIEGLPISTVSGSITGLPSSLYDDIRFIDTDSEAVYTPPAPTIESDSYSVLLHKDHTYNVVVNGTSSVSCGSVNVGVSETQTADLTFTFTPPTTVTESLVLTSEGLTYDGVLLEEETAYAFLGGGSYTWDGTDDLDISGVNFTTSAAKALDTSAVGAVWINLSGTNSFTSTASEGDSYGVYSSGTVHFSGSGSVTVSGGNTTGNSFGIYVGNTTGVSNNNVTLTATGGTSSDGNSYGIFASANASFTFGNISASGSNYGLFVNGVLNISGCTLEAEGNTAALNDEPDTLPAYYRYKTGDDTSYTYSSATPYDNTGVTSVTIEPITPDSKNLVLTTDGLTYDGDLLEEGYVLNVLGDGSYSYEGGVLTLTDVNFTTSAAKGLELTAINGVTVRLVGSNSIVSTYGTGAGISANSFSAEGSGSLTAKGGRDGITLNSAGTFSLKSGTVTANGGTNGIRGSNICYIAMSGGVLNTIGGSYKWTNIAASSTYPAAYSWTSDTGSGTYPETSPSSTKSLTITTATAVTPATYTFNKAVSSEELFHIRFSLAPGVTFNDIVKNGTTALESATEWWLYDTNTIEITSSYLLGLDAGTYTITLDTTADTDPTVTLTVANVYEKGLVLKSDGLYYDDTILTASDSKLGGGSYTYADSTLNLNGVNFTTSARRGLDLSAVTDVTVMLSGTNSISATTSDGYSRNALYSSGSFTIDGTGSLTAAGGDNVYGGSMGIVSGGTLTIAGGAITAAGGNVSIDSSYGINATGGVNIRGGTITATGNSKATTGWSRGINSAGTITITGGTVTAAGVDSAFGDNGSQSAAPTLPIAYKYKLTSGGDLTNSSGSAPTFGTYAYIETQTAVTPVTATFNKASAANITLTYALAAGETLGNIVNGTYTLTSSDYEVSGNRIIIKSTYLEDLANASYTIKINTSGSVDPEVTVIVSKVYSEGLVLNAATSKLEYDGSEVTTEILGGGSYSYSSGTLTLTNVNFTTEAAKALDLSAAPGVTLNLAGNNSFTSVNTNSNLTCGIYSSESFTVISTTGTGALTATGGSSSNGHSVGIFSTGLTVNSGTVYANSTNGYSNFAIHIGIADGSYMVVNGGSVIATAALKRHLSRAVFLESESGYLNITGGTVTATAYTESASSAIMSNSPITISGGTVTASGYTSSYGIYATNTETTAPAVTISGGTITSQGGIRGSASGTDGILISGGNVTASGGNYGLASINSKQISISGGILDLTGSNRAFSRAPTLPTYYRYKIGDDTNYTNSWTTGYSYDTSHKHILLETRTQPYSVTVTNGTADKTVCEASETVTITPTAPQNGYRIKSVTTTPAVAMTTESNGTYTFTMPAESVTVTITYEEIPDESNNDNSSNTGNSDNSGNSGSSDIAPPRREEYIEPTEPENDKDPDDNTNTERGVSVEVNGVQSDVNIAMPTEAGDKTADVTIGGKTFETYSLTAAEAIADGEVSKVIVSESGAIAAVTKGGNVIAGANGTQSLNSASTIAALEAAAEETQVEITDDSETETPLISIIAGQEVTAISDNTIEKIITVQNDYDIETRIQKSQYSVDENEQTRELIYRITIPVEETNIRDIRLGAEFSTAVVEASIIAFEKTFGNTDCAGFALTQKDTFGTEATIQVKMSAIGFDAKPGDIVYVAIFNPKTGKFTQVEGKVGESGFITFKTDKSGVVVISATPFTK